MPPSTHADLRIDHARRATPAEWDAAYAGCPFAYHFQSRDWAERWARATNAAPHAVRLTFSDGLHVTLPILRERRAGGLVRVDRLSAGYTYGGWLATEPLDEDHARLVVAHLHGRPTMVRWTGNPLDQLPAPLVPDGPSEVTHLLDLALGIEDVRRRATAANRRASRRAVKLGVRVREAAGTEYWRDYFELYRQSLRRWGDSVSSNYPWAVFAALADPPTDRIKLWLAEEDGQPLAGGIFTYSRDVVAYWAGAASEDGLQRRASNLLLATVIEDAAARGYRWFDFLSCGGHEGVHRFKETFGPSEATFATLETHPGPFALAPAARHLVGALRR